MKIVVDTDSLPSWERASVESLLKCRSVVQLFGRTMFFKDLGIEIGEITTKAYGEGRDDGLRAGMALGYEQGFDAALDRAPELQRTI